MRADRSRFFPIGTAAFPSLRFLSELSGFYRHDVATIGVSIAGSNSLRMVANGTLLGPSGATLVLATSGIVELVAAPASNQNVRATPSGTGGFQIGTSSAIRAVRTVTASVNFLSMAAGAGDSRTVTVTGAAVGDSVFVCASDGAIQPDEIVISAVVTAADTVTLRAVNRSAGVYDPPAKSYRVTVLSF